MGNKLHDDRAKPAPMEDALDFVRLDEIGRLGDLAWSYWQSITLAADRGDKLTLAVHCKQVAKVTQEVFTLVRSLGASGDMPP
jgi:hypothetical protein